MKKLVFDIFYTLFVETFANFANSGLVRETLSREMFFSKLPFAKVYLAKSFQK